MGSGFTCLPCLAGPGLVSGCRRVQGCVAYVLMDHCCSTARFSSRSRCCYGTQVYQGPFTILTEISIEWWVVYTVIQALTGILFDTDAAGPQ